MTTNNLIDEWIPVAYAIPRDGVSVQVRLKHPAQMRIGVDYVSDGKWVSWQKRCVTHWRPFDWSDV